MTTALVVNQNDKDRFSVLVTGGSGFIGTHLVEALLQAGGSVLNVDVSEPRLTTHARCWHKCDITDREALANAFRFFQPQVVVHLAARATLAGKTIADFPANVEGTKNVLDLVKTFTSVSRLIVTSTQYVIRPGRIPQHDEDFDPNTAYGASKVETERLTRAANLRICWTIIRPTNIWGPWHPNFPTGLWRYIQRRLYFYPGREPILRAYGYVGNVIWQILRIIESPADKVTGRVLYVGDRPINSFEWANQFSLALTGKPVRVVPRALLRVAAYVGDVAHMLGIAAPIYTARYRRITTEHSAPMEPTFATLGDPPFSFAQGVAASVDWLRNSGPAEYRR